MYINTLSVIVTISGILFFAVGLIIIILGKKVGEGNNPQYIKLRNTEIRTNSVITLLIITAVIALGPLSLSYMRPDIENYIGKNKLNKDYIALKDLILTIRGNVIDEGGFANKVKIKINRTLGNSSIVETSDTDQMGFFAIDLLNVKPRERYELHLQKEGYKDIRYRFGFLEINSNHRLVKAE